MSWGRKNHGMNYEYKMECNFLSFHNKVISYEVKTKIDSLLCQEYFTWEQNEEECIHDVMEDVWMDISKYCKNEYKWVFTQ